MHLWCNNLSLTITELIFPFLLKSLKTERFKYSNILNILNIICEDKMVSITLSVPEGLKQEMDDFPDINWSAVAREAIKRKITMLEKFKEFTKKSKFTEQDALNLGRELSKKISRRLRKK